MDIPLNYLTIVEEIISKSLKYGEKGRAPASTLIKGGVYSGADQLNHEIFKRLSSSSESYFNIKFLRLRLSETFLSNEIQRELLQASRTGKKATIFFMDGIDRILSLPTKSLNRSTKMGRGAKASEIVEESHRLRKILLENANKISLISSSGHSPSFMEDPDLPFYKFFNEITLSPLSPEDSAKYFFSIFKKNMNYDSKAPIISELGEIAFDWPYKISGGNWLLLQKFNQILSICGKLNQPANQKNKSKNVLDEYFSQLQSILLMEIDGFGREERRFIEQAVLLGNKFSLRELSFDEGNASSVAKKLVAKKFLTANGKGKYTFCHIPLKTLLRYSSGLSTIDAFSENSFFQTLNFK